MSEWECPICGHKDCEYVAGTNDYDRYHCKKYDFKFFLSFGIKYETDTEYKEKVLNLITEHMLHSNFCTVNGGKKHWHFFDAAPGFQDNNPEYVNVANLLMNYPEHVMDKAHRSLTNLSILFPNYGDTFCLYWYQRRSVFEHKLNNIGRSGMLRILEDLGYLKDPDNNECYSITALGWQKIDEMRKEEQIINQGFIAMRFDAETKSIREAFRTAIKESGYTERIIDEKEHNNQIVPEIFYEIERSKFVVVDVTYPNYGAYYEAGYAQALGKQVIVCCREEEFNSKDKNKRPHFDISQKSMIVWKDEADLISRLKKRIEATVN